MICPSCKSPMIVVEHKKIELDYCPNCAGTWFDSGELELFLDSISLENRDQFVKSMLDAQEAAVTGKKRKCPICRQGMKQVVVGEQPRLAIDVCRKGDGLWFDGGEITQLINQLPGKPSAGPSSHHHVSAFLGEVFKVRE